MSVLHTVQHWLGALIAQPLSSDHKIAETTPFGTPIVQEAEKFIAPSATLHPYQRVQIYHQQYWWRLLESLQSNFPTVVRLFGYAPFQNTLAVPYLHKHPPSHWALSKLGESFPDWLKEHYKENDRYLVYTAALIDWAANEAFFAKAFPANQFSEPNEEILSKKIILQPHVHLFSLDGDFFSFREAFLREEPEYYNANPFPEMRYGNFHFVLYRTTRNVVTWKEVSAAEHWALAQFNQGLSIEDLCALLEGNSGEILEEALIQLPLWFKQWTVLEWLRQL